MFRSNRREFFLQSTAIGALSPLGSLIADDTKYPLPVAAVVTVYRENSHADVIVGKILEGFDQQGGVGPNLKLVGLYVDQVPQGDMSRELARKHPFRLTSTIDDALTLGTNQLQVRGVLSIGEHGDYPLTPITRQKMYPRRRFFDEIVATFRRVGSVCPVFNDKHLAYHWRDARHMVDVAAAMQIPLMAGSSLPVTWRRPALSLPIGCEIGEAMVVGYGGLESYGFHALETLQCMVERRAGGETGVASVRVLTGDAIQQAGDNGEWSKELFGAAIKTMPGQPVTDLSRLNEQAAFYLITYRDGLKATVAMANGMVTQKAFAAKMRRRKRPIATLFELASEKPYGHFEHLTRAIDHMIQTGKPAYPVERTLLTTGMLDAAMQSLSNGGQLRETPELDVRYTPADWTFANRK